jgi:hypothetical protein
MKIAPIGSRVSLLLATAALALALVSCGEKRLAVFPVRGQMFYKNKPASGAMVILNPVGEGDAKTIRPQGMVGDDGSFEMTTYKDKDGAPAGEYKVTFVWLIENPRTKSDFSPLPLHYSDPQKSSLTVSIHEGSNELSPFQLTH